MSDSGPAPAAECPRCGREMGADAPAGVCPACLLAIASEPSDLSSEAVTVLASPTGSGTMRVADARLAPGQEFGPYRVVRLLGRGGMGEVYEAEQLEHGRRVALKVLSQRLTDPVDRARFLREGQLAASITHPNCVYIFGSEEIAGTPVITMELLAGGTLKDRVREQGPLPPAAAVDAILQIIAGLDAAQAGGILHRDIKPANCFTDRDGHGEGRRLRAVDFDDGPRRDAAHEERHVSGDAPVCRARTAQGRSAGRACGHLRGGGDALLPPHRAAAVRR